MEGRSSFDSNHKLARRAVKPDPIAVLSLVFCFLTLASLLVLLALTARSRTTKQPKESSKRFPSRSLMGSKIVFALGFIFNIVLWFVVGQHRYLNMTYIAMTILCHIFYVLALPILLYTFHQIIQRYLERIASAKKKASVASMVHSIILFVLSGLSGADCGLWIAYWVRYTRQHGTAYVSIAQPLLSFIRVVLFWLASLEVLYWAIFCYKATPSNATKNGTHSLLVGTSFFAVFNFALMILSIITTFIGFVPYFHPELIHPIVQFVFLTGLYSSLIACYRQWASSNTENKSTLNQEDQEHLSTLTYQPYSEGFAWQQPIDPPDYNATGRMEQGGRY